MWMIVIVAVASGEVVYVDSAADYDFFKSEQECEEFEELYWRRVPESNRCPRICNPLHNHSANAPL